MTFLEQRKLVENKFVENKLYVSIGISVTAILIFLFVPWLRSSNGSVSTVEIWRSLDNINAVISMFSISSEDLMFLKVALIVAFIAPVLLGAYIINWFVTKEMSKGIALVAAIAGIVIFFIWIILSNIMRESPVVYFLVLMKSNNTMNILSDSYSSIGLAQFLTPVLLIANVIILEIKPKITMTRSSSAGEMNGGGESANKEMNTLVKYLLKALPLVGIAIVMFLITVFIDNSISFFIGHLICLILAGMTVIYIGLPVGLIVTVIYSLLYAGRVYGFYLIFDSVFIIATPILLKKYDAFKIRISKFAGIGVFYGIFMFALRGDSHKRFYDGGSIIPVILHYVILCVLAYLFFEFGWSKVKPYLPQKAREYFTAVSF